MSYQTEHIATAIKDARARKGFSQRDLSANSGVPQAQISKFENGSVDLRISSLVALVRALDLELELIPRKVIPAVRSIVRSTAQPPSVDVASLTRAQTVFSDLQKSLETINAPFKEVERLQDNLRAIEKIRIPKIEVPNFERMVKIIEQANRSSLDALKIAQISDQMQLLRNQIAHASVLSEQNLLPKPAYSLDEEDDDA
jgi:transcriptional regulator with XRE-family HTH domain